MKFTDIYKESIKYWPEKIDISDAKFSNGGMYSHNLSRIFGEIEDKVGHDNPWVELMTWCISKYIHSKAKSASKEGDKEIKLNEIDLKQLEKMYLKDMVESTTGYKSLKRDYVSDL